MDPRKNGPGLDEGLKLLAEVRRQTGVPVLTDVHTEDDVKAVAAVVDVLQTPAFLCRQTDFIQAVATCGKPVNIKKGQFLAPGDMKHVVAKAKEAIRATLLLHYGRDSRQRRDTIRLKDFYALINRLTRGEAETKLLKH